MKYIVFVLGFYFTCLLATAAQAEKVYLDVSATGVRKIVVAVPYFSTASPTVKPQIGKNMAKLLAEALDLHGFVQLVDPDRYGGSKEVDWNALGVDYAVMGKYATNGNQLTVEGQIFDVAENRLLAGRRYKGSLTQQEDMVLRLADVLVEEFTGEPGVSRTSIAYVSDASGKKEIYVTDVLGRKQRQVTKHKALCVSPRFTPDGNFLAYSTYHRGNMDLYITDLRQSKMTRSLSRRKGMNNAPAFTPDGKNMVVTLSKDGNPDLYFMNRKGKILKRITSRSRINTSASFSPDGSSFAFVSDRGGRPQIYTMNMKSGRVKRLTYTRSENTKPTWSPKGDLIAFSGLVDGHYQLFVVDTNGEK